MLLLHVLMAGCTLTGGGNAIGQGTHKGHDYVDLGLSVKWATCNVGASKPEEYGDYYAWGETETKADYSWQTYKFRASGNTDSNIRLNKYCPSNSSYWGGTGSPDNKSVLEAGDDVARIKWGGDWRMPTDGEWEELIDNCTVTWTTVNGVNGRLVTSKKPGYTDKSIFLPAAGYRKSASVNGAGIYGYYWSSALKAGDPRHASSVYFASGSIYYGNGYFRYYGNSVRPVLEQYEPVTGVSLDKTSVSIPVGTEVVLTATVKPENASNKKVSWKSGDTDVAIVDGNGKVTAVDRGTTEITVTTDDGAKTAKCQVTVTMKIPDQVDLGLPSGIKWASCNLGAKNETGYGDYYSWGETDSKSTYTWGTYMWCGGTDTSLSKYNTKGANGKVDNKTVLDATDDAAAVHLGGKWRMPTQADFQELRTNCTWSWGYVGGVRGYTVTGKNNASIFLPAAGFWTGGNSTGKTNYGRYWSSSLNSDVPEGAYGLDADDSGYQMTYFNRFLGLPVRAVWK